MCFLITDKSSDAEIDRLRNYLHGKSEGERQTLLHLLTPGQRARVVGKSAVATKNIDRAMDVADEADQANRIVADRLNDQLNSIPTRVVDAIAQRLLA